MKWVNSLKDTNYQSSLKLNSKLIDKLNSLISLKGTKFYQTLKKDLVPILHKLLEKVDEEGTFLSLCYEASVTLLPKSHEVVTRN